MEVKQLTGRWRHWHRGCLWVTSVAKQQQNRRQTAARARRCGYRARVRVQWLIGVDVTAWLAQRWSRWVKAQGSSQVERWRWRRKSGSLRASVTLIHSVEYQSWLTGKDLYGLPLSSQLQILSFGETHDAAYFPLYIYFYDITYCWTQRAQVIDILFKNNRHFEVWIKCWFKKYGSYFIVFEYTTHLRVTKSVGLTVIGKLALQAFSL